MARWFKFILAIGIGIAAGLVYSRAVSPENISHITPQSLRVDFKADYVLMVAEAYHAEGDLGAAQERLVALGDQAADRLVQDAILFAEPRYSVSDITLMRVLLRDLQALPAPAGSAFRGSGV
jgi:hypothetical protein